MLANGQLDVYPRKGKTGGAYCISSPEIPTFVLLNHTDEFESLKSALDPAAVELSDRMGDAVFTAFSQNPSWKR